MKPIKPLTKQSSTLNENTGFMLPEYNYIQATMQYEINDGKRYIEPDPTMSLREMVNRQLKGQRIPDSPTRFGYYDDQSDDLDLGGTNFNELDLSEKHEVIEAHRLKLRKKEADYKAWIKEKQYPKNTPPEANENKAPQGQKEGRADAQPTPPAGKQNAEGIQSGIKQ